MSDLFIQNEMRMSKITKQYFRDQIPRKNIQATDKEEGDDYESELSEFDLEMDKEKEYEKEEFEKSYHFLDTNEGELDVLFDLCENEIDITKQYTVYLCGYDFNTTGHLPFLQFMMQLDNGSYVFPNMKFRCPTNVQLVQEDEDGKTPNHVYFENECTKLILDMFELNEEILEEDMKNVFKGYVNSQRLANTLYVVFDMSKFRIKHREDVRRNWATIDEIVNKKQLLGYNIVQDATFLFYEKPGLMQIKDERGAILDIPPVLYLCRKKGGQYENIYSEYDDRNRDTSPYLSLIDERSSHPVLGDFFVFSLLPLDFHSQSIMKIRRFVGFLEKPLYITSGIYQTPVSENDGMSLGKVIPSIVSYMSQPKDADEPKEDVEDEPKEDVEDEPKDADEPKDVQSNNVQDKDDKPQIIKEMEDLRNKTFNCAYFQEMVGEVKHSFWCIKSEDYFSEL